MKTKNKTAQQIWDRDADKLRVANAAGFDLFVIWESAFRDDPDAVYQKLIEFLSNT